MLSRNRHTLLCLGNLVLITLDFEAPHVFAIKSCPNDAFTGALCNSKCQSDRALTLNLLSDLLQLRLRRLWSGEVNVDFECRIVLNIEK